MNTDFTIARDRRLTSAVTIRCLMALREFGNQGASVADIAAIVGASQTWVRESLRELALLKYAVGEIDTESVGHPVIWRAL